MYCLLHGALAVLFRCSLWMIYSSKEEDLNLEGIFSENKETVINMYLETPGESEQGI